MAKRGVQQEDVDGAADALLMEGQRPTVERVRMKIGSGSPNNVGPMLESWFGRLGRRVAGMPTEGPGNGFPLAAQNAFRLLWETALTEAKNHAEAALAGERDRLHRDGVILAEERIAFEGSRAALEENARLAQAQSADAREQLAESTETQRAQGVMLEQARTHAADLERQLGKARALLDHQAQAHAQERQKIESRAAANERRHLQEIDAARGETTKVSEQLSRSRAAEEAARAAITKLREQVVELDHAHNSVTADLARAVDKEAAARQLHEAAERRVADLQVALASERAWTDDLRRQIATATSQRRRAPTKKPVSRTSSLRKRAP